MNRGGCRLTCRCPGSQCRGGKFQNKSRAAQRCGLVKDPPLVLGHDAVGDGRPKAGARADFLGREKRLKNLVQQVRRHARPVVFHQHLHPVSVVARLDFQTPGPGKSTMACSALFIRLTINCWIWSGSAEMAGSSGSKFENDFGLGHQ